MWIVVPAVLFLAIGVAIGFGRNPTYTAQSSLIIGTANPASPNFGGNVVAAGSLATAYSRTILATPVVAEVSQTLNLSRGTVSSNLSSAPVPDSPAFNIVATAKSASLAIQLANTASTAVLHYLKLLNSPTSGTQSLLTDYGAASVKVDSDNTALAAAQTAGNQQAISTAKAKRDRDQLVLNSLGAAYTASLQANPPTTGVSTLTTADGASNDRKSTIELLGFIGFVVGAVIGVALAMLRAAQEVQRVTVT